MKKFSCGDVVPGCKATFEEETEDKLLARVADHAKQDHGMDEVPAEVLEKVKAKVVDA